MAAQDRGELSEDQTRTALTRRGSTELTRTEPPSKHYDEHTAELRSSIESARRQISESLDDIQHTVQERLDWRGWVDEHPWETVGIGFAVGFYLGLR